ncbi:MAG: FliG C-terminal domain-containing protein, partial [bacterium]
EDLDAMGPVRLSDVEKAQATITNTAQRLVAAGKIIIARGGGGGEVLV